MSCQSTPRRDTAQVRETLASIRTMLEYNNASAGNSVGVSASRFRQRPLFTFSNPSGGATGGASSDPLAGGQFSRATALRSSTPMGSAASAASNGIFQRSPSMQQHQGAGAGGASPAVRASPMRSHTPLGGAHTPTHHTHGVASANVSNAYLLQCQRDLERMQREKHDVERRCMTLEASLAEAQMQVEQLMMSNNHNNDGEHDNQFNVDGLVGEDGGVASMTTPTANTTSNKNRHVDPLLDATAAGALPAPTADTTAFDTPTTSPIKYQQQHQQQQNSVSAAASIMDEQLLLSTAKAIAAIHSVYGPSGSFWYASANVSPANSRGPSNAGTGGNSPNPNAPHSAAGIYPLISENAKVLPAADSSPATVLNYLVERIGDLDATVDRFRSLESERDRLFAAQQNNAAKVKAMIEAVEASEVEKATEMAAFQSAAAKAQSDMMLKIQQLEEALAEANAAHGDDSSSPSAAALTLALEEQQQRCETLEASNEALQKALEEAQEDLRASEEAMAEDRQLYTEQLAEMKASHEQLVAESEEEHQTALANAQQALEEAQRAHSELKGSFDAAVAEHTTTMRELAEKLGDVEQQLADAAYEKEELEGRVEQLEADLAAAAANSNNANTQQKNSKSRGLENVNDFDSDEDDGGVVNLANLRKDRDDLSDIVAQLKASDAKNQQALDDCEHDLQQMRQREEGLIEKLSVAEADLEKAADHIEDLERQLAEKEGDHSGDDAAEELAEAKVFAEAQTAKIVALQQTIDELQDQLAAAAPAAEQLAEKDALIADLELEVDELKQKMNELIEELEALEKKVADDTHHGDSHEEELAEAKIFAEAQSAKIEALTADVERLQQHFNELQDQLAAAEEERQKRDEDTMPAPVPNITVEELAEKDALIADLELEVDELKQKMNELIEELEALEKKVADDAAAQSNGHHATSASSGQTDALIAQVEDVTTLLKASAGDIIASSASAADDDDSAAVLPQALQDAATKLKIDAEASAAEFATLRVKVEGLVAAVETLKDENAALQAALDEAHQNMDATATANVTANQPSATAAAADDGVIAAAALSTAKIAHEKEVSAFAAQIYELHEAIAELNTEKLALQNDLAEARIAASASAVASQQQSDAMVAQIEQMTSAVKKSAPADGASSSDEDTTDGDILPEAFSAAVRKIQSDADASTAEVAVLKEKVGALEGMIAELGDVNQSLQNALNASKEEQQSGASHEEELAEAKALVSAQSARIETLTAAVVASQQQSDAMVAQIEQMTSAVKKSAPADGASSSDEDVDDRLPEAFSAAVRKIQSDADASTAELAVLRDKVGALEGMIAELGDVNNKSPSHDEELSASQSAQIVALQQTVEELQGQLATVEKLGRQKRDEDSMPAPVPSITAEELAEKDALIADLELEVDELKQKMNELIDELEALEKKVADDAAAQSNGHHATSEVPAEVEEELMTLRTLVETLEDKVADLNDERQALESELADAQETVAANPPEKNADAVIAHIDEMVANLKRNFAVPTTVGASEDGDDDDAAGAVPQAIATALRVMTANADASGAELNTVAARLGEWQCALDRRQVELVAFEEELLAIRRELDEEMRQQDERNAAGPANKKTNAPSTSDDEGVKKSSSAAGPNGNANGAHLESQLFGLNATIREMESSRRHVETEHTTLVEDLRAQLSTADGELADLKAQLHGAEAALTAESAAKHALRSELEAVQMSLEDARSASEDAERALEEKDEIVRELEDKLEDALEKAAAAAIANGSTTDLLARSSNASGGAANPAASPFYHQSEGAEMMQNTLQGLATDYEVMAEAYDRVVELLAAIGIDYSPYKRTDTDAEADDSANASDESSDSSTNLAKSNNKLSQSRGSLDTSVLPAVVDGDPLYMPRWSLLHVVDKRQKKKSHKKHNNSSSSHSDDDGTESDADDVTFSIAIEVKRYNTLANGRWPSSSCVVGASRNMYDPSLPDVADCGTVADGSPIPSDILINPQFDAFAWQEKTGGNLMTTVAMGMLSELAIGADIVDPTTFQRFVTVLQRYYRDDNQYHSSTHAADVTQLFGSLLAISGIIEAMRPVEKLACLAACLAHDFEHPGRNNDYLIKKRDPIAIRYGVAEGCGQKRAILESHHAAAALELLQHPLLDITALLPVDDLGRFYTVFNAIIAGTDMSVHFEKLQQYSEKIARNALHHNGMGYTVTNALIPQIHTAATAAAPPMSGRAAILQQGTGVIGSGPLTPLSGPTPITSAANSPSKVGLLGSASVRIADAVAASNFVFDDEANADDRLLTLQILMHMADIGNVTRNRFVADRWSDGVRDENWEQGDDERKGSLPLASPLFDRNNAAAGYNPNSTFFIDVFCLPLAKVVAYRFPNLQFLVEGILDNRETKLAESGVDVESEAELDKMRALAVPFSPLACLESCFRRSAAITPTMILEKASSRITSRYASPMEGLSATASASVLNRHNSGSAKHRSPKKAKRRSSDSDSSDDDEDAGSGGAHAADADEYSDAEGPAPAAAATATAAANANAAGTAEVPIMSNKELQELQWALEQSDAQIASLQTELATAKAQLGALAADKASLQSELEGLQHTAEDLEQRLEEAHRHSSGEGNAEKIEALEEAIAELRQQLLEKDEATEELERALEDAQRELEERLRDCAAQESESAEALAGLQSDLSDLQATIAAQAADIESQRQVIEDLQEEATRQSDLLAAKNNSASDDANTEKVEALEEAIAELRQQLLEKDEATEELERALEDAQQNVRASSADNISPKKKSSSDDGDSSSAAAAGFVELEKAYTILQSDVQQLLEDKAQLLDDVERATEAIAKLKADRDKAAASSAANDGNNARVSSSSSSAGMISEEVHKTRIEQLKQMLMASNSKKSSLEEEVKALQKRLLDSNAAAANSSGMGSGPPSTGTTTAVAASNSRALGGRADVYASQPSGGATKGGFGRMVLAGSSSSSSSTSDDSDSDTDF